jgi:L-arabinose isomerase
MAQTLDGERIAAGTLEAEFSVDAVGEGSKVHVDSEEMSKDEIETIIKRYEQQFNMSSEELLQLSDEGRASDERGIVTWLLLLRYR